MTRPISKLAVRTGRLAVAAAFAWVALPAAAAHADTTLIGWTAQADANPVDLVVDNNAGLAGVHPLSEADLPEAQSDFETGPFGHGLASILWPGSTAGNLGSLSGQLGLPSQIAPIVAKANDPVRAETFYPSGPSQATYPAGGTPGGVAEMVSHADTNGTWAKAALSDVTLASVLDIKGLAASSTTTAADAASATSAGSFSSLSLLGGIVSIGATSAAATAQSDGVSPTGSSATHVGAITVAGHAVSVGTDGLVVGPASTNLIGSLLTPTVAQVNQILGLLHLTITPLPATETRQAPTESVTSAGLKISFSLPSDLNLRLDCSVLPPQLAQLAVLCTLPGELQGLTLTLTLGRATATAIATPPFNVNLGGLPTGTGGLGGGTGGLTTPGSTATNPVTTGGTGLNPAGGGTGSPGPTLAGAGASSAAGAPTTTGGTSISPTGRTTPVDLSRPIKAGLLAFLLVLAAVAGAGLFRMGRHLEDPPPLSVCPLEEAP